MRLFFFMIAVIASFLICWKLSVAHIFAAGAVFVLLHSAQVHINIFGALQQ